MLTCMRLAAPADAAAILDIYAPFIRETAITFELEVPPPADFGARVERIATKYPYIVAESDGSVMGFAYASEQHERAAYQWNAALSVYVAPSAAGRGLGQALYGALIELLQLQGYRTFYGLITLPNEASMRLHAKMGFTQLCTLRNTGYKFGRWHDVAWVEKAIGPYDASVSAPKRITEIAPEETRRVLEKYSAKISA